MKCPACKRDISRVALVNLVFTWEPVVDELVETGWHKDCYLSAQHNVETTFSKRRAPRSIHRPNPEKAVQS